MMVAVELMAMRLSNNNYRSADFQNLLYRRIAFGSAPQRQ
jgi:hypothetical protein